MGVAPFGLTNDGLGNHFAINHLAGMVITDCVLPKMIETSKAKQDSSAGSGFGSAAAAAASGSGSGEEVDIEKWSTRIVVESSELHRASPEVKCDDIEEFNHEMDASLLYNRSKMLQ